MRTSLMKLTKASKVIPTDESASLFWVVRLVRLLVNW